MWIWYEKTWRFNFKRILLSSGSVSINSLLPVSTRRRRSWRVCPAAPPSAQPTCLETAATIKVREAFVQSEAQGGTHLVSAGFQFRCQHVSGLHLTCSRPGYHGDQLSVPAGLVYDLWHSLVICRGFSLYKIKIFFQIVKTSILFFLHFSWDETAKKPDWGIFIKIG